VTLNFTGALQRTISLGGTAQRTITPESAVQRTISPESMVSRTVTSVGPFLQESAANLTGGGVLGVDVLGAFLLGDPAITSYIIYVTKKSVI